MRVLRELRVKRTEEKQLCSPRSLILPHCEMKLRVGHEGSLAASLPGLRPSGSYEPGTKHPRYCDIDSGPVIYPLGGHLVKADHQSPSVHLSRGHSTGLMHCHTCPWHLSVGCCHPAVLCTPKMEQPTPEPLCHASTWRLHGEGSFWLLQGPAEQTQTLLILSYPIQN